MSIPEDKTPKEQSAAEVALLVRGAQRGDLRAFDLLVERFQRPATAVAYRLLNHRDDAMEVVQDAFLKAFDKLDTLDSPGRFGPWLMRIVSNLALNRRRSRALRQTISLDAPPRGDSEREWVLPDPAADTPDETVSGEELKRKIAAAVAELPETQRQALILFSMAKLPQKDIAKQLGLSVQAVKWHVFSARKKLKDKLAEYLE